jgi:hypothetical protein
MVNIMLKKSEARRMVEEFNIKAETTKREEAFAFCDNDISQAIEEAAKQGEGRIRISIPTNLSVNIITNYLVGNGYAVSKMTNTYLLIEW